MPLLKGKENIGHNIEVEEEHGKPRDQAMAIALRTAGVPKKGKDATTGVCKVCGKTVPTYTEGSRVVANVHARLDTGAGYGKECAGSFRPVVRAKDAFPAPVAVGDAAGPKAHWPENQGEVNEAHRTLAAKGYEPVGGAPRSAAQGRMRVYEYEHSRNPRLAGYIYEHMAGGASAHSGTKVRDALPAPVAVGDDRVTEYQDQGHVVGFGSKQLREANERYAAARKATPEDVRHLFRGGVRHDSTGYAWYWQIVDPHALDDATVTWKTLPKPVPVARPLTSVALRPGEEREVYRPRTQEELSRSFGKDARSDEAAWNTASRQTRFNWLSDEFDDNDSNKWANRRWGAIPSEVQDRISGLCIPNSARAGDWSPVDNFKPKGGLRCAKCGAAVFQTQRTASGVVYCPLHKAIAGKDASPAVYKDWSDDKLRAAYRDALKNYMPKIAVHRLAEMERRGIGPVGVLPKKTKAQDARRATDCVYCPAS